MIIKKIHIQKFRGFSDIDFQLWAHITAISGQNGTQKTTILGIISQWFAITDENNPMYWKRPLCGGNFVSSFSEKFKLSAEFDKEWQHEWTYFFCDNMIESFTMQSIVRDRRTGKLRFWKKGDRSEWSWYMQYPVIYLSLKRIYPIWEDIKLREAENIDFTQDEINWYHRWYKKILLLQRENVTSIWYLSTTNKQTTGINTDTYDWKGNSAGQDNVWKILLAILSFKRLKEEYPDNYKWGILAIDELDATLYPASQIKILEFLHKMTEEYRIQIVFTTHSLTLLEKIEEMRIKKGKKDTTIKLLFLDKVDNKVTIEERWFQYIKHKLEVALRLEAIHSDKIDIYTEDAEWVLFAKSLLLWTRIIKNLNFVKVNAGWDQYLHWIEKKIPTFLYPNSIIILDGDVSQSSNNKQKKIKKKRNIIYLPWTQSPERLLADFLSNLNDDDQCWENGFSYQLCFSEFLLDEVQESREKAKRRFNSDIIQSYFTQILKYWKKQHKDQVEEFKKSFIEIYNTIIKEKWLSIPLWDIHEVKTN